jgi:hypothetical protein
MDYLAPDTAEEIIAALEWMKKYLPQGEQNEITVTGMERSKRKEVILKPQQAMTAYKQMLKYYAVKTLIEYITSSPSPESVLSSIQEASGKRVTEWINMGGQIIPAFKVDALRQKIRDRDINDWNAIHGWYDKCWAEYPKDKACHAWAVLGLLNDRFTKEDFGKALDQCLEIRRWMTEQVYETRAKDFNDPFRSVTYRNQAEMEQVVGRIEDNFFVKHAADEFKSFEKTIEKLRNTLGL